MLGRPGERAFLKIFRYSNGIDWSGLFRSVLRLALAIAGFCLFCRPLAAGNRKQLVNTRLAQVGEEFLTKDFEAIFVAKSSRFLDQPLKSATSLSRSLA